MSELSPKARALIQAQRKSLRPTPADRERVEAALRATLGERALPAETIASRAASSLPLKLIAGATIGACLLGAVAFRALQPERSRPESAPHGALSEAEPTPPPPAPLTLGAEPHFALEPSPAAAHAPEQQPLAAEPASQPARRARSRARKFTAKQDQLALEVQLLSRATSALRSGRSDTALQILDEHRRSFPRGALQQERRIAKAQALCSLGRLREGRAELEQLPPGTPAAARARLSCGHH